MLRLHCQADKNVCVALVEFAMMMKVEVPGPIAVRVATVPDGDVVSTQTRKGYPQCDPDTVIYQEVVPLDGRDRPDCESQATQAFCNPPFRDEMFLYPIHVLLTFFAMAIFEGLDVLTAFAQLARAYACQA